MKPEITGTAEALEAVRTVRQVRQYEPGEVSDADLDQILEIARWSGSSRNTQPWRFVVARDKDTLKKLSELRPNITWVADGALAIASSTPARTRCTRPTTRVASASATWTPRAFSGRLRTAWFAETSMSPRTSSSSAGNGVSTPSWS